MRRTIITAAIVLGALGSFAMARPVEALPSSSVETTYYSSAAMTDEVGARFLSCNGTTTTTGHTSAFYTRSSESCGGGGGSHGCYSHGQPIACPATICAQVPEFCE